MVKYLINKIPVFYSEDWSKYGNLKGKLMELKKLTERIYYTESDSKSDRPVLGYILGDKCSVMIDAGNSENHVKDYNYALEKTDSKGLNIVLSHIGIGIIHLGCMLLMQKALLIIKQMKNYIDFPHGCGVMEQ